MWQEAVRATRAAMGLALLSAARFIELSPSAAELLGTTVQGGIGLTYLDFVEPRRVAEESFRLAREGILDGVQTRRRLRRLDGSIIDAQATEWAIRSPDGPDLGLWMATEVFSDEHVEAEAVVAPSSPSQPHAPRDGESAALDGESVALDDHWRVIRVGSTDASLLPRPSDGLVGRSLIELTHPDDLPALLFAVARATTDRGARALVRLRQQDGTWREVQAAPSLLEGDATTPVGLVLTARNHSDEPGSRGWAGEIPGHLRRIAEQIEAAAVLAPLAQTADALGVTTTTDLSPRQWEIVSRLVRGQRVTTIAAEMYLSRSTVRNHLSAIYAKVGVHSQEELLALYRNGTF
jgi:DNA-binding CsgD family transcriptional regulator/PAS domain-containing protein